MSNKQLLPAPDSYGLVSDITIHNTMATGTSITTPRHSRVPLSIPIPSPNISPIKLPHVRIPHQRSNSLDYTLHPPCTTATTIGITSLRTRTPKDSYFFPPKRSEIPTPGSVTSRRTRSPSTPAPQNKFIGFGPNPSRTSLFLPKSTDTTSRHDAPATSSRQKTAAYIPAFEEPKPEPKIMIGFGNLPATTGGITSPVLPPNNAVSPIPFFNLSGSPPNHHIGSTTSFPPVDATSTPSIRPAAKQRRISIPVIPFAGLIKRKDSLYNPTVPNPHTVHLSKLQLTPTAALLLATLSALLSRSETLYADVKNRPAKSGVSLGLNEEEKTEREEEEERVRKAVEELRNELDKVRKDVWEGDVGEIGGGEVERELKGLAGWVEGILGEVVKVSGKR